MHSHPLRLCLFFFLPVLALSAPPAGRQWSQGDPTADEQVAMEWLNAGRKDPVATLNSLLGQADADPLIAAWLAGESPATASQLEQGLQAAYGLAQANSLAFPNSARPPSPSIRFSSSRPPAGARNPSRPLRRFRRTGRRRPTSIRCRQRANSSPGPATS
jgi:hypothetical protein